MEATGTIWHDSFTLRSSDGSTQVRLARFTELAFSTFGGVELYTIHSTLSSVWLRKENWTYGNDMISYFNISYTFSD